MPQFRLPTTSGPIAELGYLEEKSTGRLQDFLKDRGFAVETGLAGIPTSFLASRGSGRPVIGILAEFDALPGLSQAAVPHRQPRVADAPGHACGHHLFGAASALAAAGVADWLDGAGVRGTVRLYGTPAEEGGSRQGVHDPGRALRRCGHRPCTGIRPTATMPPRRAAPQTSRAASVFTVSPPMQPPPRTAGAPHSTAWRR